MWRYKVIIRAKIPDWSTDNRYDYTKQEDVGSLCPKCKHNAVRSFFPGNVRANTYRLVCTHCGYQQTLRLE